jgi:hypothetical protein
MQYVKNLKAGFENKIVHNIIRDVKYFTIK